jgi:hypothetical protein
MTRTEKSGIVTRNCATISKSEEVCELDKGGALLCYCLTNYCNGATAGLKNPAGLRSLTAAAAAIILAKLGTN